MVNWILKLLGIIDFISAILIIISINSIPLAVVLFLKGIYTLIVSRRIDLLALVDILGGIALIFTNPILKLISIPLFFKGFLSLLA